MGAIRKSDVLRYCDMAAQKGLLNTGTAGGWKAAVKRVLELHGDDDDVGELDVHAAIIQYNNRHPGNMTPESLRTYEVRVGRAIAETGKYLADPARYRPPTAVPRSRKEPPAVAAVTELVVVEDATPVPSETRHPPRFSADVSLAMPFPLRPGFLAQVVIPRDLTKREADRLCAFIQTLALEPATEAETD